MFMISVILTASAAGTVSQFQLTNYVSIDALEKLEASTGIPVFEELTPKYQELASQLDISLPPKFASQEPLECSRTFFEEWRGVSRHSQLPTWKTLIRVLKGLQMNDLAKSIEDWLMRKPEDDLSSCSDSYSVTSGHQSREKGGLEVQYSDSERDTGLDTCTKPFSEGVSLEREDELERVKQDYHHLSQSVQALEEIIECREEQLLQCEETIHMYRELASEQLQQMELMMAENEQLRKQIGAVEEGALVPAGKSTAAGM